jgi:hypothetical protein
MFVGDTVGFRVDIIAGWEKLERIPFCAWLGVGIALLSCDFGEMEDEALLLFVAAKIDEQREEIGMFEHGFATQGENEGGDVQPYVLGDGIEGEGGVCGLSVPCVGAFNHSSQYLMKPGWLFHEWFSGSVLLSMLSGNGFNCVLLYLASTRMGKVEKSTVHQVKIGKKFMHVVALVVIYREIDKKGAV